MSGVVSGIVGSGSGRSGGSAWSWWRMVAGLAVVAVLAAPLPAGADIPTGEAEQIPIGGLVLDVERFVAIPDDSRPASPRLNHMTSIGQRVFVGEEHDGRIYELVDRYTNRPRARLFFDVSTGIDAATGGSRYLDTSSSFHGGLRGIAFHPEFASNGLFYTSVMESRPSSPSGHHYLSDADAGLADGVVIEWRFAGGSVDPDSYREVFRVGSPEQDHMIKEIAFDPHARPGDPTYGLLYVAHGDGSIQSTTVGGGLRLDDALGKILRVNPRPSGNRPYTVPADNPFVGRAGLDEIWSLGHRNPHNLSFARWKGATHLIVGEAGRDNLEEINVIRRGGNYGWAAREGTYVHLGSGGFLDGLDPLPADEWRRNNYIYPAAQWFHQDVDRGAGFVGQAAAGGHVVTNGSALQGLYLHADFAYEGKVFHSRVDDLLAAHTRLADGQPPSALTQADITQARIRFEGQVYPNMRGVLMEDDRYEPGGDVARSDLRFGQDPDGTIYIMNKRNGWIYRVVNSVPPGGPGSFPGTDTPGGVDPDAPSFVDDDGSVFEEDIEWLASRGITRGCNPPVNDRFCPNDPVTRGQMAAFLVRALALPAAGNSGFTDTAGSVFVDDIERLAGAGITRGCTSTAFCPDDLVTREQMAAFLVRAYGFGGGAGIEFVDDDGSIFEGDIRRLAAADVTRGCNPPENDRYCPKEPVTRGQMAAFIRRAEG